MLLLFKGYYALRQIGFLFCYMVRYFYTIQIPNNRLSPSASRAHVHQQTHEVKEESAVSCHLVEGHHYILKKPEQILPVERLRRGQNIRRVRQKRKWGILLTQGLLARRENNWDTVMRIYLPENT